MKIKRTNSQIQSAREFGRYFENREKEMTFDWPETPEEEAFHDTRKEDCDASLIALFEKDEKFLDDDDNHSRKV